MRSAAKMLLAAAALALLPATVQGAIWRVELDGSGDFTSIQDAVDAAESGDTIRIGPGRWYEHWVWIHGSVRYTIVQGKSLTFIGSGMTSTVIGHEVPPFSSSTRALAFLIDVECEVTRFADIGFDMPGIWGMGIANFGERIEVQNCRFTRLRDGGVFTEGIGGGFVRQCAFNDISGNSGVSAYTPARDLVIEHCSFNNCYIAVSADWDGCRDITIQHCTMTGGRGGVAFIQGASGSVRHCVISGQDTWGIVLDLFGIVEIEHNEVSLSHSYHTAALGIHSSYNGRVLIRNNIFESSKAAFWVVSPFFELDCRGNHFLQHGGQGWLAWAAPNYAGDPVHLDLTGNWWGTTDTAYIAEHIWDGHDDPQVRIFFDYEPFADGPIPTEGQTWSRVRERFRD